MDKANNFFKKNKVIIIAVSISVILLVVLGILFLKENYETSDLAAYAQLTLNDASERVVSNHGLMFLTYVNLVQSKLQGLVNFTEVNNNNYNFYGHNAQLTLTTNPGKKNQDIINFVFGKTLNSQFFYNDLMHRIESGVLQSPKSTVPFYTVTLYLNNNTLPVLLNNGVTILSFVNQVQNMLGKPAIFNHVLTQTLPSITVDNDTGFNAVISVYNPTNKMTQSIGIATVAKNFYYDLPYRLTMLKKVL